MLVDEKNLTITLKHAKFFNFFSIFQKEAVTVSFDFNYNLLKDI
jgi:hypothetical protein